MAVTYENITPSPIENTVVDKGFIDGVHKIYRIGPIEGYVLHDNGFDWEDEFGNIILGYAIGTVTVRWDYDFTANPRELYAVPANSVPADQIFGIVPGGEPEVM